MKKIDFTSDFSAVQQSPRSSIQGYAGLSKEHLQELFVCNDTVTVKLLTERRNIKKWHGQL